MTAQGGHVETDAPGQVVAGDGIEVQERQGSDLGDVGVPLLDEGGLQLGCLAVHGDRVLELEVVILELGVQLPEAPADPDVEGLQMGALHAA